MSDDDLDEELELEEPEIVDDVDDADDADVELDPEIDGDFELDEEDLEGVLDDDDLGDDDLVDDDLVDVDVLEDDTPDAAPMPPEVATAAAGEDEDEDDVLDPDDVEASLDDILKDRLVIEDDGPDDDEDETPDVDDRGEASVVVPKRADEFVCQSCFLVKHVSQIADNAKQLCRDCV
jgi:Domain of unknown function (DUF4193)